MDEKKVDYKNLYHEEDEIDLYELWQTLKRRKKIIVGIFLFSTILTAIISLIMTPIYRSESSVMPISSKSSPLGNLANLATIAGISVGSSGDSAKIIAVLNSRTIKEEVIKDLNLINILLEKDVPENRDPMNVAIGTFENMISISEDKKTGVININVEYKDPEIAQKIASKYIEKLQEMMNEKSLTVAKFDRKFLEEQLKQEEKRLKELQQKFAEFQKRTKIIEPSKQLGGILNLYSNLVSKRMELLVKLKSMESAFSPNNPQIKVLREQINAINKQISKIEEKTNIGALPSLSNAPDKIIEYTNLMRELKVSETVYETLVKMYQQAKLQEAKENIYIEIIDPPSLPDKPIKPKKKLMVAVAGVSSLILGIFLAFFLEWIDNIRKRNSIS